MKIMLIRHPEIEGAEQLRFFGITDVALSEQGHRQAGRLADFLCHRRIKAIYCSHLQRAKYPAQLIAQKFNLGVDIKPGLGEVNFGRWEGNSYQQMLADDEQLCRTWLQMAPEFRFPEGESLAEFNQRVMQEYNYILATTADTQDDELIVVVTHGGVLRLILTDILGMEWKRVSCIRQDFGALNIIEYQDGHGVLQLMNDTCYLGQDGYCV